MNNKILKTILLAAGLTIAASATQAQGLYSRRTETAPAASKSSAVAGEQRAGIYNPAPAGEDDGLLRAGGTEGDGDGHSNKITDDTVPAGDGFYLLFAGGLLYMLLSGSRFRAGRVFPQETA